MVESFYNYDDQSDSYFQYRPSTLSICHASRLRRCWSLQQQEWLSRLEKRLSVTRIKKHITESSGSYMQSKRLLASMQGDAR
jgi:hypothetical protein